MKKLFGYFFIALPVIIAVLILLTLLSPAHTMDAIMIGTGGLIFGLGSIYLGFKLIRNEL